MLREWEIWLDCHLSPILAKWLSEELKMTVRSCYTLQATNFTDRQFYETAKSAGQIIIVSKDADLAGLVNRYGSPPKLVIVRKGNCDNKVMLALLAEHLPKCVSILTTSTTKIIELY
ncbi:MAG: DUF5615 family PIN-like protein [Chitinophagaceae bacterium]|nr:DUF5615 family PIN-like protein [Chitinophagaceae bacterium]